jgi:hypothetical protein
MLETKKCIISAYIVLSISLAVLYHNYIKQPDKFYPFPVSFDKNFKIKNNILKFYLLH